LRINERGLGGICQVHEEVLITLNYRIAIDEHRDNSRRRSTNRTIIRAGLRAAVRGRKLNCNFFAAPV
jgi:hypothetical protein